MPIIQDTVNFGESFPPVLARSEGLRAVAHVDLDLSLYPVQKVFAPGFFAGTTGSASKFRLLPRTRVVSISSAVITVSPFTAAIFVPGDVITQISMTDGTAGTAVGTVLSVNHAANTVTLTAAPGSAPSANTVIGVATSLPVKANGDKLGIVSPNTALNFSYVSPNSQYGCFASAAVYRGRLPHWDTHLQSLYPEIITV